MKTQEESKPCQISIYLAGGFHSGWQERVKESNRTLQYIDPSTHGLQDIKQYTFWDLEGISSCDWLFGYMEENNPGGYALALEIGYAKALGKRVILVDEKSPGNQQFRRYWDMCRACADVEFECLEDAITFLDKVSFSSNPDTEYVYAE